MNNEELSHEEQLDVWNELIAYWRFYPDVFLECITPYDEDGRRQGISLGDDQKLILRAMCRFPYTHIVLPRGYGKTLIELLSLFVSATLTPDLTISMSAQTLMASAGMFSDKIEEIKKFYPILASEIVVEQISKDRVYIVFKSGAKITNLENKQTAKGKRRNLVFLEECALMDEHTYRDALEPLVSENYKNIRDFAYDPFVQNRQAFITTAYMKNEAYERCLKMFDDMVNLKRTFCLGADYHLPAKYGRGRSAEEVEALEEKVGFMFFNTNYRSRWLNTNGSCIVDMEKLGNLQVLPKPELKPTKGGEYYLSVDVARSTKNSNNETAITVLKVKRDKKEKVKYIQAVNMIKLPNGANFQTQAL